jgi:sugar (pentulose or hexulose) kinase
VHKLVSYIARELSSVFPTPLELVVNIFYTTQLPHNLFVTMQIKTGYYIGIDVGTGSARACLIDHTGEIVSVASENIGLWQPEQDYYVCASSKTRTVLLTWLLNLVLTHVGNIGAINLRYLAMHLSGSPPSPRRTPNTGVASPRHRIRRNMLTMPFLNRNRRPHLYHGPRLQH